MDQLPEEMSEKLIVNCPFEENEIIEQKLLAKHLKKCPKAKEINEMKGEVFYTEGINFFNQVQ